MRGGRQFLKNFGKLVYEKKTGKSRVFSDFPICPFPRLLHSTNPFLHQLSCFWLSDHGETTVLFLTVWLSARDPTQFYHLTTKPKARKPKSNAEKSLPRARSRSLPVCLSFVCLSPTRPPCPAFSKESRMLLHFLCYHDLQLQLVTLKDITAFLVRNLEC
jgi:hypothetical protein